MKPWMLPGPRHRGAHYHGDVIDLLLQLGVKKGVSALWYSEFSQNQLDSDQHSLYSDGQNTRILHQVCATRGAVVFAIIVVIVEA